MKKLAIIVLILLGILVSLNTVSAQQTVQSTTFPSVPSLDKPAIWLIATPSLSEPARVSWQTIGVSGSGSFNKISDTKWFCYFSNDQFSTCGSSPFTGSGATSTNYII